MTYQDWCKYSTQILLEAEEFNSWQREIKEKLLLEIGPRIAKLGKTGYLGCGFHYDKEIQFGKLIQKLAYPWQPCANHCKKIEDQQLENLITKLMAEGLIEDIEKAEKTV